MKTLNTQFKYIVFSLVFLLTIFDFHQSKAAMEKDNELTSWACVKAYRATVFDNNSQSKQKVTRLKRNTPVQVIENKMGWTKVKSIRQQGWVKSYNLNKGLKCALITHNDILVDKGLGHKLTFHQPVKILKQGFGKNLVQDNYKRSFWVHSRGLWPKDPRVQKVLSIP